MGGGKASWMGRKTVCRWVIWLLVSDYTVQRKLYLTDATTMMAFSALFRRICIFCVISRHRALLWC